MTYKYFYRFRFLHWDKSTKTEVTGSVIEQFRNTRFDKRLYNILKYQAFDRGLSPLLVDTHQPMTSKLFRKIRSVVRTEARRLGDDFKCQFWRAYVQEDTNVFPYVWHIQCGRDPSDYYGDITPDYIGRYSRFVSNQGKEVADFYTIWTGYPIAYNTSTCYSEFRCIKSESEVQNPS